MPAVFFFLELTFPTNLTHFIEKYQQVTLKKVCGIQQWAERVWNSKNMQIKVPYLKVYFEDLGHYFIFFWRQPAYHVPPPSHPGATPTSYDVKVTNITMGLLNMLTLIWFIFTWYLIVTLLIDMVYIHVIPYCDTTYWYGLYSHDTLLCHAIPYCVTWYLIVTLPIGKQNPCGLE